MPSERLLPETHQCRDGSSLSLLRLPFAFTQDKVLTSEEFIEEAEKMDQGITLGDLADLCRFGFLVPLYRIDDQRVIGRSMEVLPGDHSDLAEYARRGQVRDPADEGHSIWWPIAPRRHAEDGLWWDGFYFARWQLLHIRDALSYRGFYKWGESLHVLRRRAFEDRRESILLSALATRHLPGILGQVTLPTDGDLRTFDDARYGLDDAVRIRVAGAPEQQLVGLAENLLAKAHIRDPMIEWWPLLRHSDHTGWSKLKGPTLFALWQRIAAEILLQAHEYLADLGVVEALPAETSGHFWKPLYDRIRSREADGLDQVLANLGLSPHPRVVLVVEGETERIHVSRLLEEFGLSRPNQVRLVNLQGSNKSPRELARYASTPRLGRQKFGRQFLSAPPTALFVAMDPENLWATEETRATQRSKIQSALQEEVRLQGGTIRQLELDALVKVFVWGDQCYELANFSDDELVEAMKRLADIDDSDWSDDLRRRLKEARACRSDIKVVFDGLHIPVQKTKLAQILLPVLLNRLKRQFSANTVPPVLRLMVEVRELVARLSGSGYVLGDVTELGTEGVPEYPNRE